MNIQPKNDRILVKMMPDKISTILEVARDSQSWLIKGEVLAIGPKVRSQIAVGECVVFTQACKETLPGTEMMLIRDGDLAGIVPAEVRVTGAPRYES